MFNPTAQVPCCGVSFGTERLFTIKEARHKMQVYAQVILLGFFFLCIPHPLFEGIVGEKKKVGVGVGIQEAILLIKHN